ncbi:hypothetical protein CHU95_03110 [Niveispirillum lacus]|uniref:Uncharacterized protein n=1 Tax=Niveispirillum lacus TaxID=1981099 RepID=A0A255Z6C6_9PROT|nr:hypothetical protein [Niveispirillum lacus]OYQ36989.1 hypothetical protein CHU95_03110 [Niveispirillum lacus]
MTRLKTVKTSFTGGCVSPDLLGRGDLAAFENGALTLTNVLIEPTGGITRRPGTGFIAHVPGPGRLIPFTFNTEQTYLLVFTDLQVSVFGDDRVQAILPSPWTQEQLSNLTWAQSGDVLLVCHPDREPRRISRVGPGLWNVEPWVFAEEEGRPRIPFFRFADPAITLTPSGMTGRIRLRASAPLFTPGHEGAPFRIHRKPGRIAAVRSGTEAEIDLADTLPHTNPTADWDEAAFSPQRGWPLSVAFHQDRLVIGGSRDLPNRLWLSKSGDLFNFDLGEGEDDSAIEFAILSDEVNPIRAVHSGRHLQVFTTGGEWAVTGVPLTPTAIRLDRQTRIGSVATRNIPPQEIDGGTLFAAGDGSIRDFLWTDLEQSYSAADLTLTTRPILPGTVDLEYDRRRRLLLAVQADGTLAVLTLYRNEQIRAWVRLVTAGRVLSTAQVGAHLYWLVDRDGRVSVEVWDDALHVDAGLAGSVDHPTARWTGLHHLDGRPVAVLADGAVTTVEPVIAGRLRLPIPARQVQAGLAFTHEIEPMPPNLLAAEGQGRRARLLAVTFRLKDTPALRADLGRGPVEVPLRRATGPALAMAPAPGFTGDRRLTATGWQTSRAGPPWRIAEERPLPFTLLSVTHEMKVND